MADQTPERNPATDPNWVGVDDGGPDDSSYHPSTVEATRAREQGLGVGQTDLEMQRDPTRPVTEEEAEGEDGPAAGAADPPSGATDI